MIINENLMDYINKAYKQNTNQTEFSITTLDFKKLKDKKFEITYSVPPSYYNDAKKIIENILQNEEKIKRTLTLEDDFIRMSVVSHFESIVKEFNPIITEEGKETSFINFNPDPFKLAEYFPIKAKIINEWKQTKNVYIYLPTKRNMKKKIVPDIYDLIMKLILYNIKENKDNYTITIGKRTYKFTNKKGFIVSLSRIFPESETKLKEIITEDIITMFPKKLLYHIKEKFQFGNVYINVKVTTNELGLQVPEEFKNGVFDISITINPNLYPSAKVVINFEDYKIKLYNKKETSLPTLSSDIDEMTNKIKDTLIKMKDKISEVYNLSAKHGFLVFKDSGRFSPDIRLMYELQKDIHPPQKQYKKDIHLTVNEKGYDAFILISKPTKVRQINKDYILDNLKISDGKLRVYLSNNYILIEHSIERDNLDDIFKRFEYIDNKIDNIVEDYIKKKEITKNKLSNMKGEYNIVLYLMNYAGYNVDPSEIIGRDMISVYSSVTHIVKKIASIKDISAKDRRDTIENLIDNKYIKIDNKGNVLINNIYLSDLLKEMNINNIGAPIKKINDDISAKLLEDFVIRKGQIKLEDLIKKGIFTPEVLSLIIRKTYITILEPTQIFTSEYNGKPIWAYLDDEAKNAYINTKCISTFLYDMVARYEDVFRDKYNDIMRRLLHLNLDLAMKYIAESKPQIVTKKGKLQLYEDKSNEITAIKSGRFLIELASITDFKLDADKIFIVYDKNDGIGMPIKGKTIEEIVSKANRIYDNFKKEFQELVKLEKKGKIKLETITYKKRKYNVYKVMYGEYPNIEEHVVKPNILEKINEKLNIRSNKKEDRYTSELFHP